MNENKKVAWLYVVLTMIISGVAVLFQFILDKFYLEAELGLYKSEVLTPEAFYVYLTVAVFLVISSVLIVRRDALPKDIKHGFWFTTLTSFAAAAVMIFSAVSFFMSDSIGIAYGAAAITVYKLRYACSVIAFPTGIYYFAVAFSGKNKTNFTSVLSFFPIVWTLLFIMSVYFDHSVLINSPVRVIQQLALIVLMLYQLFESRTLLGISKPILYFIFANLSVLFLSTAFIPEVISLVNGTAEFSLQTTYYLYGSVVSLYVLSRCIGFAVLCSGGEKKKETHKPKAKEDLFTADDDIEETDEQN